ncbi:MAG TPA: spore protease YyaC [Firmicutes bacterium]|nr:spore protease YyaC [Candidatus Fermentithermobacillaceae bacterium]
MPAILEHIRDIRIDAFAENGHHALADALRVVLKIQGLESKPLKVVCIGTDRSTGDSLGPLVGSMLISAGFAGEVWGTLESPVHAVNLTEIIPRAAGGESAVIAVDACLGRKTEVGSIMVGVGPVLPGAGLRKRLPGIGDAHVTGVVNVGGFMDYAILQCTRLYTVVKIASVISRGLLIAAGQDRFQDHAPSRGQLFTIPWARENA